MTRRNRSRLAGVLALALASGLAVAPLGASTSAENLCDRVEEEWELVVASPSPEEVGPQVTTCMTPADGDDQPFIAFNLNHIDYPSFSAGGMQVQAWQGTLLGATATAERDKLLETQGETVIWTQAMWLSGGVGHYRVQSGALTSWGSFGNGNQLELTFATDRTDLSGHDPARSVARSGVTWQANRVTRLRLMRVRTYTGATLLSDDQTPRSVVLEVMP